MLQPTNSTIPQHPRHHRPTDDLLADLQCFSQICMVHAQKLLFPCVRSKFWHCR